MKFPKTIYATLAHEGEHSQYLSIHKSPELAAEIGVKKRVGVYELVDEVLVTTEIKTSGAKEAKPSRGQR